jgi:hypothetical protein
MDVRRDNCPFVPGRHYLGQLVSPVFLPRRKDSISAQTAVS